MTIPISNRWEEMDGKKVDGTYTISVEDFIAYWAAWVAGFDTVSEPESRSIMAWERTISRAIYKGTECGAWLAFEGYDPDPGPDGQEIHKRITEIVVGSIVEGVDWGTEVYRLRFPFKIKDLWKAVEMVNEEAKDIWNDTHGCADCYRNPDTGEKQPENEYGYFNVDPNCKTCEGHGVII